MNVIALPTARKLKRVRLDTPKNERVPMPTASKAKRPKAVAILHAQGAMFRYANIFVHLSAPRPTTFYAAICRRP
jgi:hypothetical protein